MTGLLSPAAYGQFALGLTAALLLQQVLFAPLANSAARFYAPSKEKLTLAAYYRAVESQAAKALAAFLLLGTIAVLFLWAARGSMVLPIACAALAYAGASGCTSCLNGIQNAARQRPVVAVHNAVETWLRPGYSVILVLALGPIGPAALFGYFLASLTVLLSQIRFYRRLKTQSPPADTNSGAPLEKSMWRFGSPFVLFAILAWVQLSVDRWSLELFQSDSAVGRYQALYQVFFMPLIFIGAFIAQLAGPVLFGRAGDGTDKTRLDRVYRTNLSMAAIIVGLASAAALAVMVIPNGTLGVFLGPRFRGELRIARLLILSGGLVAVTQIAVLALMAGNLLRKVVVPRILCCVLSGILCVVGARHFGLPGVAAANLLAALLTCLWLHSLVVSPMQIIRQGARSFDEACHRTGAFIGALR